MEPKTKIQKVIEALREQGATDEQVTEFLANLTKTSFSNLYSKVAAFFTEEDLVAVEACKTQEEISEKVKQLYALRTGKNPEEEAQKFLDVFAEGFLAEYEKTKNQPLTE